MLLRRKESLAVLHRGIAMGAGGACVLGCVLACAPADARALTPEELDSCRVGAVCPNPANQTNKCCYHARRTTCAELAEFLCMNTPVCTAGFQRDEECGSPACNTGAEGDACNTAYMTITKKRCTATGNSTATGCTGTQRRCEFNETDITQYTCTCSSGYTECTGNPPQYLHKCKP